jgi:NAD(P)-dependent dehydrogenase (short-subunit alcohol dehydrogenase family)
VVADRDEAAAASALPPNSRSVTSAEFTAVTPVDIRNREAIAKAIDATVAAFGGLDILINTAALFPVFARRRRSRRDVGHHPRHQRHRQLPARRRSRQTLQRTGLDAALCSPVPPTPWSPSAVSEAYDVSKAALSHLVRELAVGLAPRVRVNGISPATVVKGSTMFPRDRVRASLTKYNIPFRRHRSPTTSCATCSPASTPKRTLTHQPIDPADCAEAILFSWEAPLALHHRPPDSRRWRPDRGVLAFELKRLTSSLMH